MGFWDSSYVLKVIGFFAAVLLCLLTVRPHSYDCSCCVAVGFELLFSLADFGLLDLNDNVFRRGMILLEYHYVSAFDLPPEIDAVFELYALRLVTVLMNQRPDV